MSMNEMKAVFKSGCGEHNCIYVTVKNCATQKMIFESCLFKTGVVDLTFTNKHIYHSCTHLSLFPPSQQAYGGSPQYGGAPYCQQPYPQQGPVTAQPTMYIAPGPLSSPANDYLAYSIFTMICCCLPLGIAALIYSINVSLISESGSDPEAGQWVGPR